MTLDNFMLGMGYGACGVLAFLTLIALIHGIVCICRIPNLINRLSKTEIQLTNQNFELRHRAVDCGELHNRYAALVGRINSMSSPAMPQPKSKKRN